MNESIGSIEVGRRDTTMIDNGIDNDFYDTLGFDDYNPKDDQNQINLTEMNNTNFEITSLSNDDILNQLLSTNSIILDPHQSIPDLESPLKEVGLKAVISDNVDDQRGKKKTNSKNSNLVYLLFI
ncbi:hypothetical protein K502DRAFT_324348 [Neoconidiobolus thromboides FSU 785]|nr:hypothetical protein K502DRAFT_324348 [Neoconidiobolus thromboides FSU 785]